MKILIILLSPIILLALSPFETPKRGTPNTSAFETPKPKIHNTFMYESQGSNFFDTSAYETKNKKIIKGNQVSCRYTCDKRVYKEEKIKDAVEFYKKERKFKQ